MVEEESDVLDQGSLEMLSVTLPVGAASLPCCQIKGDRADTHRVVDMPSLRSILGGTIDNRRALETFCNTYGKRFLNVCVESQMNHTRATVF